MLPSSRDQRIRGFGGPGAPGLSVSINPESYSEGMFSWPGDPPGSCEAMLGWLILVDAVGTHDGSKTEFAALDTARMENQE